MRVKGTLFALLVLSVLLIFAGCDTSGGGGGGLLYVVAAVETDDSGDTEAFVMITEGGLFGTLVTDATVTVNGETLTYVFLGYFGILSTPVSAGGSVTLNVQRGGSSINATLQMPEKPVITAPIGGSPIEPDRCSVFFSYINYDPLDRVIQVFS